jgi:hypothetical protein
MGLKQPELKPSTSTPPTGAMACSAGQPGSFKPTRTRGIDHNISWFDWMSKPLIANFMTFAKLI